MNPPVGPKTDRIAFGFVLVASIVRSPRLHVAFLIATRSAAAGAPGITVTVVVRVTPNHDAVIVTVVLAVTGEVLTAANRLRARGERPVFFVVADLLDYLRHLMSDDSNMNALTGTQAERAAACVAAGCDVALPLCDLGRMPPPGGTPATRSRPLMSIDSRSSRG